MKKEEIINYLQSNKDNFSKKYKISQILLFGSFARGDNDINSDIDIAIKTPISDYFLLYDFKEELEKRFNKKVDIVRLREKMNNSLKKRILKEAIYV